MAKKKTRARTKAVADYRHADATRLNNPTAARAHEDVQAVPSRRFEFDPHLSPELVWAGKADESELTVEAPSIHVHERLSTDAILKAAQQENAQIGLFADPGLDRAKQVEFYEHEMGWANRLILGDSLVGMTSLLERERLAGQVQLVYIDPPYGINYNSNFQARISDRAPKETDDQAITREPEQIQAYRDTWQLGIHSYLTYLRQRLIAARELLAESGSVFVQIGPDNAHLVRALLDEVFGPQNACPTVTVQKTAQSRSALLSEVCDYLLWYARDRSQVKYRPLLLPRGSLAEHPDFDRVLEADGTTCQLKPEERFDLSLLPDGARVYKRGDPTSQGYSRTKTVPLDLDGQVFQCSPNRHWTLRVEGMQRLWELGRLEIAESGALWLRRFWEDAGSRPLSNVWTDTSSSFARLAYVVQTVPKIIERAMLMTTDPGDLVVDPTCGSGTTAYVAERYGRRWITIDTSRVAVAIARERLLTAGFDYYQLADPVRGVDAGLVYEEREHLTTSAAGYGGDPDVETYYDRPRLDRSRARVSGPFTVEALSRYADNPFEGQPLEAVSDEAAADHVSALLDSLRATGIPRKGAPPASVLVLDPLAGAGALHAEGTFADADGTERQFAVSLGPRHGPITVAQIDEALAEAPGYDLIVFAGFATTAEAQEYLAPGRRGRIDVALLEANADLLLGDLLKNTKASQTFRLFAAPEATVGREPDGKFCVEVLGMDSFDAATGQVVSRSRDDIAAWFLDHDYDGSVFHVNQAFFTRSDAWSALGKALKDTIDKDVVESMHSYVSLPFEPGPSRKAAIRVVDDAGQTSEAILDLDG